MIMLKPQDIVVLLKLAASPEKRTYATLAKELGMSPSEVHGAGQRAVAAGLLDPLSRQPVRQALLEFLVHGLRYVFPPKMGPLGRGMPTGRAALPISRLMARDEEPPPVWPDPEGKVRGLTLQPLYPSVPKAARQDRSLYEFLALVDSLREGRARERKLAEAELTRRLLR
jgi:hypothetical protein